MATQLIKNATIQPHGPQRGPMYACAISPDGTLVATGGCDGSLCITNIATQATVYKVECGYTWGMKVAWSPDGTRLVAATSNGSVIEVTNGNAHSTVFKIDKSFYGCAFSSGGILAVGGDDQAVTLLDPSNNYSVIQRIARVSNWGVCRIAFSPDGNIFAAGCGEGHVYIYGLTNDNWVQVSDNKHHFRPIKSLCFSHSGRMLLVTSEDKTASIWNVPSGTKWTSAVQMSLKGHTKAVFGGAFLGDESHVITGSHDGSLRIWRTSGGVQTANYECGGQVSSLSYHSASGNIVVGFSNGHVEMWKTAPYIAPPAAPRSAPQVAVAAPIPVPKPQAAPQVRLSVHECVRERLSKAQAQVNDIQGSIGKANKGLRQQMTREYELKRSIADLEVKLASEKKALAQLQTLEYIAESRGLTKLMERHNELLGIIHMCTQTLDSLTDCLAVSGLEDLRGEAFKEWLCDIGMGKLQTALNGIDGISLTMLNVDNVIDYDVTFNDAAALQLRGYIAHYKLSDDSAFSPPRGSVLSWDHMQTANWIRTLNTPFTSLSSAGWHGAALCSLSPPRVIEASKGALKVPEAVKFIGLVRKMRSELDGDKATWVTKWSGYDLCHGMILASFPIPDPCGHSLSHS